MPDQKIIIGPSDFDSVESGFFNLLGFRLAEWDIDLAVLELEIGPQHLNRARVLHGGVLTAMIDTACGFAGCFCAIPGHQRKAVTLSLTTSFMGQASAGTIRVIGRKRASGRKIYVSNAEVVTASGELIALGEGTYRYRTGSENSRGQTA